MLFYKFLVLFILGGIAGWILEVVYRSIRQKKMINPGFLNGCLLPIYGFGVVLFHFICGLKFNMNNVVLEDVLKIVICSIIATLIELLAGIICEKLGRTRLWDYSENAFNYKGYICLKFSIIWGVIAALYGFFLYPVMEIVCEYVLAHGVFYALFAYIYGILTVDLIQSLGVAAKLRTYSLKVKEIVNLEKMKLTARDYVKHNSLSNMLSYIRANDLINKYIDFKNKRTGKDD